MGIPAESGPGRKEFEKRMEVRRWEENPEEWKRVRRAWCLGGEAFRKELIEAMGSRLGAEHDGEERRETAQAKAERMLGDELKKLRWQERDLELRRKGDRNKVKAAKRFRCETTMTWDWIAEQQVMGAAGHTANRRRKSCPTKRLCGTPFFTRGNAQKAIEARKLIKRAAAGGANTFVVSLDPRDWRRAKLK